MVLKSIKLPPTERFAGSPVLLKRVFGDLEVFSAYMGTLRKRFSFDSRCTRRPKLRGPVVASLAVSRERTAILQLYAVSTAEYPDDAVETFAVAVLPGLRAWLDWRLARPETAALGHYQMIVEWAAGEHRYHELRYL